MLVLLLKKILLILLLYSGLSVSNSQIQFSHIDVSNGLPGTIIRKIIQDNDGYMWFATKYGLARYDGYKVEIINDASNQSLGDVWAVINEPDGSLLIASKTRGLFRYKEGEIEALALLADLKGVEPTSIERDREGALWVGTNKGDYKVINNVRYEVQLFKDEKSYGFLNIDNHHILSQTNKNLRQYNINNNSVEDVKVDPKDTKLNYKLHKDNFGNIWLGRANGLYLYDEECRCFKSNFEQLKNIKVYTLNSDKKHLWIGTLSNGLYRYNYATSELVKIYSDQKQEIQIENKSILSIYFDNSGVIWIGTFHSGVIFINPTTFAFHSIPEENGSKLCIKSQTTHDVLESKDGNLWLATSEGVTRINQENQCTHYNYKSGDVNSLSANNIISLYQTQNGDIWVTNATGGLDSISSLSGLTERKGDAFSNLSFNFSYESSKDVLILGSHRNGLFAYNVVKNKLTKFKSLDNKYNDAIFYVHAVDKNNRQYFGTNKGVVFLNNENIIESFDIDFNTVENYEVDAIAFDNDNNLWLGIMYQYLLKINTEGITENITDRLVNGNAQLKVLAMIPVGENIMWISSNNGLYKINTKTYENWNFVANDGLQNTGFLRQSYEYGKNGKIYFGGKKGVNSFFPKEIVINNKQPQTVLTAFKYFNKELSTGVSTASNFKLDKPINYLHEIELNYEDYIIGFDFAALDFADSMRNQYAYRMKGLYDNWVYVDANNRQATYTNLKPDDYIFQVKASNKDGTWNELPKELKIKVHPAPWFSPWAYFTYILFIVISIWAFIRYKTIASRKRAQQLEKTVKERTQEVNLQKKMVESLLDHKNEVLANITHEFKTPLALILGPTDQLLEEAELQNHSDKLSMIQRNAQRLMLMVGQILKLSQAELDKEVIRESQAVQSILTMLYEAFKPLANDKNIELVLSNDIKVNVFATSECLEIVIGNLLSNALKFTNSGGKITISSKCYDNQVSISVKDTGIGIESKNNKKMFKRFVRLDAHKNIQGTGIGLSVVKEIAEANNGHVDVISEWGKGSEFTVTFPISDIRANEELSQIIVDQMVENTNNEISLKYNNSINTSEVEKKHNQIQVLIIEDNLDMQTHIGNVLKNRFNCIFADRGREGIALALKEVPDVIICDVMMPEMDGYQVTRILRHDTRTSHIPIILLTALNTKESRIKGWRENIDIYVSKPFDAMELNVQIDNILIIRKMLQQKTNKAMKSNNSLQELDLPQQDLIFIKKFKNVIEKYYTNEYFQKADLASKMAISERQLQRKIKALINKSPMDMLRDIRLEKATIQLRKGYQVGLVSDNCGFSSTSYFGSCFKKKYGVTPKKYQSLK